MEQSPSRLPYSMRWPRMARICGTARPMAVHSGRQSSGSMAPSMWETKDRGLSAFARDGVGKWHALGMPTLSQPQPTTPALDSAGNVYYCTSNVLWCLNPEGIPQWYVPGEQGYDPSTPSTASPTIAPDGTIYASLNA